MLSKLLVPHNPIELEQLEGRLSINAASTNKANQLLRELVPKIISLKLMEKEFKLTMFLTELYSKQPGRNQVCG